MEEKKDVFSLKRWDGQIFTTGHDVEWLPLKIKFGGEVLEPNDIDYHHYVVSGHMWDVEFNTGFKVHKVFETYEAANCFFNSFIKRYPHTRIKLRETKAIRLKSS